MLSDVEDTKRKLVVTGEDERRRVHDPQFLRDRLAERQSFVPARRYIDMWISGVDAVDAVLPDQQRVGVQLERALD